MKGFWRRFSAGGPAAARVSWGAGERFGDRLGAPRGYGVSNPPRRRPPAAPARRRRHGPSDQRAPAAAGRAGGLERCRVGGPAARGRDDAPGAAIVRIGLERDVALALELSDEVARHLPAEAHPCRELGRTQVHREQIAQDGAQVSYPSRCCFALRSRLGTPGSCFWIRSHLRDTVRRAHAGGKDLRSPSRPAVVCPLNPTLARSAHTSSRIASGSAGR